MQLFFWALKVGVQFWWLVLGSFEKVFGNESLCEYVYILMPYMVIWALVALEFIRIFILTISSGNGIGRCVCCEL